VRPEAPSQSQVKMVNRLTQSNLIQPIITRIRVCCEMESSWRIFDKNSILISVSDELAQASSEADEPVHTVSHDSHCGFCSVGLSTGQKAVHKNRFIIPLAPAEAWIPFIAWVSLSEINIYKREFSYSSSSIFEFKMCRIFGTEGCLSNRNIPK
jgi:hypothetical protein